MSEPTLAVTARFEIKREHVADFFAAIDRHAHNSLTLESGCHQFDVCVNPHDPTQVFLYETYDDAEAFEVHRETDYFAEFGEKVAPWIVSKDVATWTITGEEDD